MQTRKSVLIAAFAGLFALGSGAGFAAEQSNNEQSADQSLSAAQKAGADYAAGKITEQEYAAKLAAAEKSTPATDAGTQIPEK